MQNEPMKVTAPPIDPLSSDDEDEHIGSHHPTKNGDIPTPKFSRNRPHPDVPVPKVPIKAPSIEPLSSDDDEGPSNLKPEVTPQPRNAFKRVAPKVETEISEIPEKKFRPTKSPQPPKKVQKVRPVQKVDPDSIFPNPPAFTECFKIPPELNVEIKQLESRSCRITWEIPQNLLNYYSCRLELSVGEVSFEAHRNPEDDVDLCVASQEIVSRKRANTYRKDLNLKPGAFYRVKVDILDRKEDVMASGSQSFRASFSIREIGLLYNKAIQFAGELMHPFEVMYRCKPLPYFDKIYNANVGGNRLMMPYLKDENGQAACPINKKLKGLFFSAHRYGENLPSQSPFGEVRMIMDAEEILDFDVVNLYFCDFYCNSKDSLHYVTIVVCKTDSVSDKFCKEHLLKLDPYTNKFLKVVYEKDPQGRKTGKPSYFISAMKGFLVELYYTEPISLFAAKEIEIIETSGKGTSRAMGLPHYKQCVKCNLYPVDFRVMMGL